MDKNKLEAIVNDMLANRFNHTLHAYIDIAGELVAGTLLSQIMYWFSPKKDGTTRARIIKDGEIWIAKQRTDWWDEIRITERQYDRAMKLLVDKGLVVNKSYKFNGMPTIHIRPNFDVVNKEMGKWKNEQANKVIASYGEVKSGITQSVNRELHKVSNGDYTNCNSGVTQSVNLLTEITSETTTEITNNIKDIKEFDSFPEELSGEFEEKGKEKELTPDKVSSTNKQNNIKKSIARNVAKSNDNEAVFKEFAKDDTELLEALRDFESMRKTIKKPLVGRAAKLLINKLEKEFPDRNDQIATLNQSMECNYLTVYPLKKVGSTKKPGKETTSTEYGQLGTYV